MPRQKYEITNTVINLFKYKKIIVKSPSLAHEVIILAQKILTIFKKSGNIEAIHKLNEINIKRKNGEVIEETIDSSTQINLLNKIKLCLKKITNQYNVIQECIIPAAYNSRNRNGGEVQKTKILSNNLNSQRYKNITVHVQLTLIDSIKEEEGEHKAQV